MKKGQEGWDGWKGWMWDDMKKKKKATRRMCEINSIH